MKTEEMTPNKWKREIAPDLSFVELTTEGACSPHQLLELVLLHLHLAPSLGANSMHGRVVAQTLNVGHASAGAGSVDGKLITQTSGGLHLVTDKGTSRRLVGLATIGVARFTNGEDSGVGGILFALGLVRLHGLGLSAHVHGDRGWGRVEGAKTTGELLDGHVCLGAVEHLEIAVGIAGEAAVHLAERILSFGHAVSALHRLDGVREGEDDIVGLVLHGSLGEDRFESFRARGWGDRGGHGDRAVNGEERGNVNVYCGDKISIKYIYDAR